MTQEILFLIFLLLEGVGLILLYQLYLVPRVISPAVVSHWLEEIESGRINLPQVLESYTGELIGNIDALLFGYTDKENNKVRGRIQKFYEGAAGSAAKSMQLNPEGFAANMLKDLADEPWYIQAIAQKLMPSFAMPGEPSQVPTKTSYEPGIARK